MIFLSDEDLEIENAWHFSSQDPKLWKLDGTAFWLLRRGYTARGRLAPVVALRLR